MNVGEAFRAVATKVMERKARDSANFEYHRRASVLDEQKKEDVVFKYAFVTATRNNFEHFTFLGGPESKHMTKLEKLFFFDFDISCAVFYR